MLELFPNIVGNSSSKPSTVRGLRAYFVLIVFFFYKNVSMSHRHIHVYIIVIYTEKLLKKLNFNINYQRNYEFF